MIFSIYRFDPAVDQKPRMQEYELDIEKIQGKMLLNALEAIKEQNPDLAFRRSCGEGVCGSDGININGKNGLACVTRLHDLPNRVTLMPLPGFPVIRDLIVDMEPFFDQYKRIKPYLQNTSPAPEKERLQSPEQRAKLDGLYECILCACCTASCPSYWWNPDKFVGPAGLLNAYRFVADNRDNQTEERLVALEDPYSVFRCRTIMNCANVCPKGLNPTEAIRKLRTEMLSIKSEPRA
ncbi:MAG: succinate dehydrogenase iron-sulfur subunit [Gammaproteobacteria bacterium RIFCSPLOWO2_02_FULL_42_14]|nr:MAG: succinate dehydrogenase iron-sulfur subunit [Gammaproteobacteria bacterium RIFCSPHIGHO2_02_FULL_42_43]OGT53706.1 MAG: succinate dehydrogenase iron-sulfur subunit [Gammaproteobacteria bacterium RIFCSPHIGHO2_12_FULL_41_25]OGT62770.1 MAG: succinate dehydrogenase iron-sulfur subunit [Gammaproteobacteria bacterium RIFCSPLOWO2_02_FULL_42_14]OGT85625.1 MAG: succinate dehydrogenase iron-sulfur subunit [Gammaproteobacteria bacterium RIFCSPLOWO2_12_FULL_42_18]